MTSVQKTWPAGAEKEQLLGWSGEGAEGPGLGPESASRAEGTGALGAGQKASPGLGLKMSRTNDNRIDRNHYCFMGTPVPSPALTVRACDLTEPSHVVSPPVLHPAPTHPHFTV